MYHAYGRVEREHGGAHTDAHACDGEGCTCLWGAWWYSTRMASASTDSSVSIKANRTATRPPVMIVSPELPPAFTFSSTFRSNNDGTDSKHGERHSDGDPHNMFPLCVGGVG